MKIIEVRDLVKLSGFIKSEDPMILGKYDPLKGERYAVIGEDGFAKTGAAIPDADLLKQFYRDMVKIRAADDKAFALQRQGRIGTYPQLKGSEAVQVGAAHALEDKDWIVPSYRENGLMILRGVPIGFIYLYWAGNEAGAKFPEGLRILPFSIPVGSQPLHAVGIGMGANISGEKTSVLAFFGDGATSEGEWHEAMNFAGVFNSPVVFFCTNNQFAISSSPLKQTKTRTFAEKAAAYGFEGVVIDGMDVIAVYQTISEALQKARTGGGPTMIEAVTYRLCDHTTSDDASIYRDPKEFEEWQKKEPVLRFKKFLDSKGLWFAADEEKLNAEVKESLEIAAAMLESQAKPTPEEIFGFAYDTTPSNLKWQLNDLKGTISKKE